MEAFSEPPFHPMPCLTHGMHRPNDYFQSESTQYHFQSEVISKLLYYKENPRYFPYLPYFKTSQLVDFPSANLPFKKVRNSWEMKRILKIIQEPKKARDFKFKDPFFILKQVQVTWNTKARLQHLAHAPSTCEVTPTRGTES